MDIIDIHAVSFHGLQVPFFVLPGNSGFQIYATLWDAISNTILTTSTPTYSPNDLSFQFPQYFSTPAHLTTPRWAEERLLRLELHHYNDTSTSLSEDQPLHTYHTTPFFSTQFKQSSLKPYSPHKTPMIHSPDQRYVFFHTHQATYTLPIQTYTGIGPTSDQTLTNNLPTNVNMILEIALSSLLSKNRPEPLLVLYLEYFFYCSTTYFPQLEQQSRNSEFFIAGSDGNDIRPSVYQYTLFRTLVSQQLLQEMQPYQHMRPITIEPPIPTSSITDPSQPQPIPIPLSSDKLSKMSNATISNASSDQTETFYTAKFIAPPSNKDVHLHPLFDSFMAFFSTKIPSLENNLPDSLSQLLELYNIISNIPITLPDGIETPTSLLIPEASEQLPHLCLASSPSRKIHHEEEDNEYIYKDIYENPSNINTVSEFGTAPGSSQPINDGSDSLFPFDSNSIIAGTPPPTQPFSSSFALAAPGLGFSAIPSTPVPLSHTKNKKLSKLLFDDPALTTPTPLPSSSELTPDNSSTMLLLQEDLLTTPSKSSSYPISIKDVGRGREQNTIKTTAFLHPSSARKSTPPQFSFPRHILSFYQMFIYIFYADVVSRKPIHAWPMRTNTHSILGRNQVIPAQNRVYDTATNVMLSSSLLTMRLKNIVIYMQRCTIVYALTSALSFHANVFNNAVLSQSTHSIQTPPRSFTHHQFNKSHNITPKNQALSILEVSQHSTIQALKQKISALSTSLSLYNEYLDQRLTALEDTEYIYRAHSGALMDLSDGMTTQRENTYSALLHKAQNVSVMTNYTTTRLVVSISNILPILNHHVDNCKERLTSILFPSKSSHNGHIVGGNAPRKTNRLSSMLNSLSLLSTTNSSINHRIISATAAPNQSISSIKLGGKGQNSALQQQTKHDQLLCQFDQFTKLYGHQIYSICGIPLFLSPIMINPEAHPDLMLQTALGLGYAAQFVHLLSSYLAISIPYPISCNGPKSGVFLHYPDRATVLPLYPYSTSDKSHTRSLIPFLEPHLTTLTYHVITGLWKTNNITPVDHDSDDEADDEYDFNPEVTDFFHQQGEGSLFQETDEFSPNLNNNNDTPNDRNHVLIRDSDTTIRLSNTLRKHPKSHNNTTVMDEELTALQQANANAQDFADNRTHPHYYMMFAIYLLNQNVLHLIAKTHHSAPFLLPAVRHFSSGSIGGINNHNQQTCHVLSSINSPFLTSHTSPGQKHPPTMLSTKNADCSSPYYTVYRNTYYPFDATHTNLHPAFLLKNLQRLCHALGDAVM